MAVYPGDPSPEMIQVTTISEQGYTDFQLKTGMHHDQHFGQDSYYLEHPLVSADFAKQATDLGVSVIGLDTPSHDRSPYAIHKILLREVVLVIENLTNLSLLKNASNIVVFAFPPKFALEASPVRVIARIE